MESVNCVVVTPSGDERVVRTRHDDVHVILGGPLTIVGADADLGLVFVALREADDAPLSILSLTPSESVDSSAHGDIVVTRTNRRGRPIDVDIELWRVWCARAHTDKPPTPVTLHD